MSGRIKFSGPTFNATDRGIKFPGGGDVSAVMQTLQDPSGNSLPLSMTNAAINIGVGAITNNGVLTVKGSGGNIVSFRNSANVEVGSFTNGGTFSLISSLVAGSSVAIGNGTVNILPVSDGVYRVANAATTDFTRFILGTNNVNGISLVKSGTEMRAMLGDGTQYINFRAAQFQSDNLSAGALAASSLFKVGSVGAITDAGLSALGLRNQIAIEIAGAIYYIPVSNSLIP